MKVAVISTHYPGPDLIYGDSFVHARVKQYLKTADARVFGYNHSLTKDRAFEYEGVMVLISNDFEIFKKELLCFYPDVIAIHLVQGKNIPFFIKLDKPLAIFVHGYEALSWRRRLMNYTTLGDIRYLIPYIFSNTRQLKRMRDLAEHSTRNAKVSFVFVSNWLKKAVVSDLGTGIKHAHVIPNGIDVSLFKYQPKDPAKRKKILLLRSFRARNYAIDIAIDAILLLSQKEFFSELEIAIYGEGYLFPLLTKKLEHLKNVSLNNFFVENKKIPELHEAFGVFLCPSRLDTQGVSMCEAMASGLVPVTSPIGGIPEFTEDGISGLFGQTPEEIAGQIQFLYHHPEEFVKISAQARKAIEDKCSLEQTIPQELNLLNSMTGSRVSSSREIQQCTRCVLSTSDDPFISFDAEGVCSFCRSYIEHEKESVKTDEKGQKQFYQLIEKIKKQGKGREYDCIIGLSGGVDSTYLALKAKQLGLRPLAVHFDNGWNSELAVNNIENIVNKLGFDLHTVVIDWEEFRDLQLAFLKASVVDIEVVTDHAIFASLYKLAVEHNIKYILSGVNFVTESILPPSWIHDKRDHVHIKAISNLFGKIPLNKYPLFNTRLKLQMAWKGITSVALLNYIPYVKADVKKEIEKELSWRDYGGKHYESVFTRFYQGYILPEKFKIDKRRAHLSNLINSGQITRNEALEQLQISAYPEEHRKKDYDFVLKKLGLNESEFQAIMKLPIKKHSDYPVDIDIYKRFPALLLLNPVWKLLKKIKGV